MALRFQRFVFYLVVPVQLGACELRREAPERRTDASLPLASEDAVVAAEPPAGPAAATSDLPPSKPRRDVSTGGLAKPTAPRSRCPSGPVIELPDPAFEAEVRARLAQPEGDIQKKDLAGVQTLNLTHARIDELDPCLFAHLENLRELYLGPGGLVDLSPVADLVHLETLRAAFTEVSDLAPLTDLVQLGRLDLGHTRVTDLSPLGASTKLRELLLDGTPVEHLDPLAGCTALERLSLEDTRVRDLSPLRTLESLRFLYIAGAPVEDTDVLAARVEGELRIFDD